MMHRNFQLIALLVLGLVSSSNVSALGIGVAKPESYIGEPLSIRIPLFNVSPLRPLVIEIDSEQFDGEGQPQVTSVIERSGSEVSIRLSSVEAINEPYISFKLDLLDVDDEVSKEFVILLDLRNKSVNSVADVSAESNISSIGDTVAVADSISNDQPASPSSYNDELMGPYDTAQAGRIPKKFGAVLNGQSIWRVARRINEAMGVTKSQMIWALYVANPNAFSSKSITSLNAGVFLDIPDQSVVAAISDEQAQENLRALRLNVAAADTVKSELLAKQESDDVGSTRDEFNLNEENGVESSSQFASENASDESNVDSFQITGVALPESLEGAGDQAQKIITSLSETVSSMSQQLERKDQKIEFLENQVAELTSFIEQDGGVQPSLDISEAALPSVREVNDSDGLSSAQSLDDLELVDESTHSESADIVSDSASDDGLKRETVAEPQLNNDKTSLLDSLWKWLLISAAAIAVLAFVLRDRIASLARSLNLFGSNEHVELRTVMIKEDTQLDLDSIDDDIESIASLSTRIDPKISEAKLEHEHEHEHGDLSDSVYDSSILKAVEESLADSDTLSSMSYLSLADDGSDDDMLNFDVDDLESGIKESFEADLSFDERFEQLLNESDFSFARELLDFARYNEIDDDRYHCERLRICEKMKDEDGFYEYYYEIESKIPSFSQNLQTQISQLVVQLAHH